VTGIEHLVATRGLALTRFAYLLCGDRRLAEDLVQSALERTFLRWESTGSPDRPEAYVRQVIVREHLSRRRRRSSTEVVVADPPERATADEPAAADERDRVWRQLTRLAPRQRAVLVLRYYEDLDDAAIAAVLGWPAGTVRSTASRALAVLRADPVLSRGISHD